MKETLFKKAFRMMIQEKEDKSESAEIDKVIKYAPTLKAKKAAKHDKELMLSMKDNPIEIVFVHEMESLEVAKDLLTIMSVESIKESQE